MGIQIHDICSRYID